MADPSYILFNKSLQQCRTLGARGGRAYGRNLRARRARMATPLAAAPLHVPPRETTALAIALLDAQFPWLCRAELRVPIANKSVPGGNGSDACRTAPMWPLCA
jgi:hypothetical protein